MKPSNLFDDLATPDDERFDALLVRPGVTVERIVSRGHRSPEGFWYDQPRGEWVVVLTGEARLRFEDEHEARTLRVGDHVFIAAHRRHRVDWTLADTPTVWLAVHLD